jgi:hypothetical protein
MTAGASHGHPLTGAFRLEEPSPAIRSLRTSTLADAAHVATEANGLPALAA